MYKKYRRRTITLLTMLAIAFICLSAAFVVKLTYKSKNGVDNNLNIPLENIEPTNQKEDVEIFVNKLNVDLGNGKLTMKDGTYEVDSLDVSSMMFKPDMGWVKVVNYKIIEYSLYFFNSEADVTSDIDVTKYYTNCYVQKSNDQIIYEELTTNKVVNVKNFGATGDISKYLATPEVLDAVQNPSDNRAGEYELNNQQKAAVLETNAIQKAVEEVNKTGGILYFPYGTYHVAVNDFLLDEHKAQKSICKINCTEPVIVELGRSTIKQVTYSNTQYYNFPSVNIFLFTDSEYGEVRNGTLIGDRQEHDYRDWLISDLRHKDDTPYADTHEFGYGVFFSNTKKGVAKNLTIKEFAGDGVVVKNGEIAQKSGKTFETIIEDCHISDCRRQGISILDSDVTSIKNNTIYNIGHSTKFTGDANKGTAPMAGIDVEPGGGTKMVNSLKIEGLRSYHCSGGGLLSASVYVNNNVEITNSYIEYPIIHGAKIKNTTLHFNDFIKMSGDSVSLKCCEFENVDFKFENWSNKFLSLSNLMPGDAEKGTYTDKVTKITNCRFYTDIDENGESARVNISGCKKINGITFENFKGYINNNGAFLDGVSIYENNNVTISTFSFKNSSISVIRTIFISGQFENCYVYMPNKGSSIIGVIYENTSFKNCNFNVRATNDIVYRECSFDSCEILPENKYVTLVYDDCFNKPPTEVTEFTSNFGRG